MALAELLSELDGKAELTAEDALAGRREVFGGDSAVSADEAAALMTLNADAGAISPEWRAFFIEAMTDYVVRQAEPQGYVDETKAGWLTGVIQHARRIRVDEVEMLVHVLEQADATPAGFSDFILGMVKALCLRHVEREGQLRPADVERLRRVIFAKGGARNIAVTRAEAETLFDINNAMGGTVADPVWTDLFVRAVGDAVLFESAWAPDAAAELGREAWLADATPHPLRRLAGLGDLPEDAANAFEALRDIFDNADMRRWSEAVNAGEAMELDASDVTTEEAHWLVARIRKNGRFDANERALLAFLRREARRVDPSLGDAGRGLEAQPGPHEPGAAPSGQPVFGRRRSAA